MALTGTDSLANGDSQLFLKGCSRGRTGNSEAARLAEKQEVQECWKETILFISYVVKNILTKYPISQAS